MIHSTQLWIGSYPEAYEDDVNNWIEENSQQGQFFDIDCSLRNWKPTSVNDELLDNSLDAQVFTDADLFFEEGKTILLRNAQAWDQEVVFSAGRGKNKLTATVWQLVMALQTMSQIDNAFHVGLIFQGALPSDEVEEYLINGSDDVNSYALSYTEPAAVAEWIAMWLGVRGYSIAPKQAAHISDHLGSEIEMVSVMIRSLRNYIYKYPQDEPVTYARMSQELGLLGAVPFYKLTDAIESGDLANTRDMVERLVHGNDGGLRALRTITNRFNSLLQVVTDDHYRPAFAANNWVFKNLKNSARLMGTRRLTDCMVMINSTEAKLKGQSNMFMSSSAPGGTETTAEMELDLLASFICSQFAQAKRKTKKGSRR